MTPRTSAAAIAVFLSTALLTSCSDDPDPDSRRGIDARAYYEDYESVIEDDGAVNYSAQPTTEAEDASGEPPLPPAPNEDNFFRDHGTSGFVETATDARSTFALDVDTGSYGVARNLLGQGFRVPPAGIRVEEWVNAFEYDDPAPTDADLGLTTETGRAPTLEDGTQLVRVGISAREVSTADRPRVNITLVVDRSGSMDIRERLGLVQSSLALLADRLDPDDTVSVVSFEDQARPLLPPTPVKDTEAILAAIEELEPGGSTNLEAGLRLGYDIARETASSGDPEAVNLVVLASDGVANVGHTGPGSIVETIQEEGADGIHLVTVGYGLGNYNDHLMEQLADLGDGFYAYVDTYAEAEQLFGEDLVTTLTPVAGEARTQVAFDPELVTSYRLVGYDNRAIADEDFTDPGTDAGELGAGHHATALYEVRLAPGVEPGAVIGTAAVRWNQVGTGSTERQQEAVIDLVAADEESAPSYRLELAATVADLAQVLKHAAPYADRTVTLDGILDRARALAEVDVAGADDLVTVVEQAIAVE
ncbi:vWA domain-containing protein [Nocardioides bizhenqiangii]|uniref:von Willebrand factor type A domain-containing protein n=1 Tax=Nocardioides bizhenqiangii TaxID=3095076 RepID=A0ABZ0ZS26_9ACTN|nr:von Willebrand factor type A domain-containing protein [Nocardioides sp. HM61]WQQ26689.1 von Willebrand factor type A domain-containing protein [Nocardioides sp. HM61]